MSTETGQRANSRQTPPSALPRKDWGRALAVVVAAVFFISTAFPAVAGFVKDTESWPKWWGTLDVAVAFVLALLAFVVFGLAQGRVSREAEDASYRTYRILTHGILAMLVVFFLFSDRIIWSQCLTGFAWRAWLLLYSLPAWFALFGPPDHPQRAEK